MKGKQQQQQQQQQPYSSTCLQRRLLVHSVVALLSLLSAFFVLCHESVPIIQINVAFKKAYDDSTAGAEVAVADKSSSIGSVSSTREEPPVTPAATTTTTTTPATAAPTERTTERTTLSPITASPITASPVTARPLPAPLPVTEAPTTTPPAVATLPATETPPMETPAIPAIPVVNPEDDLLLPQTMLRRLRAKRAEYHERVLARDYGPKLYQDIFMPPLDPSEVPYRYSPTHQSIPTPDEPVSIGQRRIFTDPTFLPSSDKTVVPQTQGTAWDRMVQKYQIKLLQVQLSLLEDRLQSKISAAEKMHTTFTWATGGTSSTASHGNKFEDGYTQVMHRAIQPILHSLGIDFISRNYGRGGSVSSQETALCLNSLYGKDVDVLGTFRKARASIVVLWSVFC